MLDTNMLIGSDFVAGDDAPEPIVNPKTEEVITNLPDASVAHGARSRPDTVGSQRAA